MGSRAPVSVARFCLIGTLSTINDAWRRFSSMVQSLATR